MKPLNAKRAAIGLGTAGALALGVAAPALAFANDPAPNPGGAAAANQNRWGQDRDDLRAERQAALIEGLAKELGVSQEKVTAAVEKVQDQLMQQNRSERQAQLKTRLDQAVADSKLTREQADAILAAVESGAMPGRGGPNAGPGMGAGMGAGMRHGGGAGANGWMQDRDEFRAERQAALIEGLAKELGVSQDKVAAAVEKVHDQLMQQNRSERQSELKSRLDQAVADGKLTQAQADAILAAFESGAMPGRNGTGMGPGMWHGGGFGR